MISDAEHRFRSGAAAVLCTAVLLLSGCGVSLQTYDDVRAALPAEELVELDGQWVHFVRQGAGEPVALIHGFGGSTYSWRDVQPVLAESYDVVAIDLNGFGYTERPVAQEQYSLDAQAALVIRLLNHLGIDSAHVIGHSYGAGVTLLLALDYPERVRSIVLVDGGPAEDTPGPSLSPLLASVYYFYAQHFLLTPNGVRNTLLSVVYNKSIVTDEVVHAYLDRLRVEGLRSMFEGFLHEVTTPPRDINIQAVQQPAFVIWGVHDPVFPLATGEQLATEIPGARIVEFEGSGHLPMEEEPERFTQEVGAFLADE